MNKIKKALKYVVVWFYFVTIGFVAIILLTGAFRFAVAFIENRSPVFLEWFGIIFVALILGCIGLICYIDEEE